MRKILVLAVLFLCSCSGKNVLAIHPMMTYGAPVQPNATMPAAPTVVTGPTAVAITMPASAIPLRVLVIAQAVNIRDVDLHATGEWLTDGSVLAVKPSQDGWYQIVDGKYAGDFIWSGCTSVNENRTCESK